MGMIEVRREQLMSPTAQALVEALNADLRARYPEGDGMHYFRLDADEVRPGRGAFVVAYDADTPVGCGAVRMIDAGVAEIKRMYVLTGYSPTGAFGEYPPSPLNVFFEKRL